MGIIRILLLADTHLGFDLAFRPRVERRRRGPEFFANFKRTMEVLNAAALREIAPPTMNIDAVFVEALRSRNLMNS